MAHPSKTICPLPFSSISYSMTGEMGPCTQCNKLTEYQNIEDYWKHPNVIQLQNDMKAGIRNAACNECYNREDAGAWNTRQWMLEQRPDFNYDDEPKLRLLWLRFSNICNYKCIDCNPTTSSLIFQEMLKRGAVDPERDGVIYSGGDEKHLLEQVKKHVKHIDMIAFSGGEPLLHWQHWDALEYIVSQGIYPEIRYFTNLSILSYRKKSLIELWSHFPKVTANVGFDAWGDGCNYFRGNMSFEKTVANCDAVMEALPQTEIIVTVTFTWLNAINAIDMILWFMENRPNFTISPNQVIHRYLDLRTAPYEKKRQIERAILKVLNHTHVRNDRNMHKFYSGMISLMFSNDFSSEFPAALKWLRDMDNWRKTDFREVFPEHQDIKYEDYDVDELDTASEHLIMNYLPVGDQ